MRNADSASHRIVPEIEHLLTAFPTDVHDIGSHTVSVTHLDLDKVSLLFMLSRKLSHILSPLIIKRLIKRSYSVVQLPLVSKATVDQMASLIMVNEPCFVTAIIIFVFTAERLAKTRRYSE